MCGRDLDSWSQSVAVDRSRRMVRFHWLLRAHPFLPINRRSSNIHPQSVPQCILVMPHQPWNDLQFITPYFDGSLGRCWPASHPVGVSSHQPSRQRWKLPTRTYCMFILLSLFPSLSNRLVCRKQSRFRTSLLGFRTCHEVLHCGADLRGQSFASKVSRRICPL